MFRVVRYKTYWANLFLYLSNYHRFSRKNNNIHIKYEGLIIDYINGIDLLAHFHINDSNNYDDLVVILYQIIMYDL